MWIVGFCIGLCCDSRLRHGLNIVYMPVTIDVYLMVEEDFALGSRKPKMRGG